MTASLTHNFDRDIAVIGAGRIGLPWAAVLANDLDYNVTCVDTDSDLVGRVNSGDSPFTEPGLDERLKSTTESGRLRATTEPDTIKDHKYVTLTLNAQRGQMEEFLATVREYASLLIGEQVLILRSTLPINQIDRVRDIAQSENNGEPQYVVYPERLAEGRAIEEIRTLPKIIGVDRDESIEPIQALLDPLESPITITDPETAMFVKLIDNTYRDGLFAIGNQIAYVADELGLNATEAIEIANEGYPRNDIPVPGVVGGKCLPKDPHFLMDETICEQPTTPDLFSATRRTNASLPSYIAKEILKKQPEEVTLLGTSYKKDVSDTYNSPPLNIADRLEDQGVSVTLYDPYVLDHGGSISDALVSADVVVIAMNHSSFVGLEETLNEHAPSATVYDVWGELNEESLELPYDGFGLSG